MPSCNQKDRDYLVYEFSRQGASDVVPNYFLHKNWDLDTAIGKICSNNFPFPVLQLQADSDPAQPPSIFVDVATQCPHVQLEWIKTGSLLKDGWVQIGERQPPRDVWHCASGVQQNPTDIRMAFQSSKLRHHIRREQLQRFHIIFITV
ncbi:MAG: hypothetical protein ABSF99_09575 [Anaerolineales bacterium]|jgi:hypothetical protein